MTDLQKAEAVGALGRMPKPKKGDEGYDRFDDGTGMYNWLFTLSVPESARRRTDAVLAAIGKSDEAARAWLDRKVEKKKKKKKKKKMTDLQKAEAVGALGRMPKPKKGDEGYDRFDDGTGMYNWLFTLSVPESARRRTDAVLAAIGKSDEAARAWLDRKVEKKKKKKKKKKMTDLQKAEAVGALGRMPKPKKMKGDEGYDRFDDGTGMYGWLVNLSQPEFAHRRTDAVLAAIGKSDEAARAWLDRKVEEKKKKKMTDADAPLRSGR